MDIPASPPTFSFPRITRRRRHTNAGPAPSLQQQPGGTQTTSQPQDANPLNSTVSSIAPIISLVRSGPFNPALLLSDAASPTNGSTSNAVNQPTSATSPMTGTTNGAPIAAPPLATEPPRAKAFRIRLVPHLESSRSLHFDPIVRDVKVGGAPLRVGRFTDRATNSTRGNGLNPNDRNSDKVAFRSKVVSRAHAELWAEENGKFFLKDTKSSSGTFINHMRLSPPGQESLAHLLKDGDVIQLGVDYQGGTEEMYRCVKIKVEVGQGREWQGGANAFNTAALKQLRALQAGDEKGKKSVGDCCICLFAVGVCQSLFIAPCSHTFHYKCIRPMLELHHPGFSCPLCRTFADLEADVEVDGMEEANDSEIIDEAIQKIAEADAHHAAGVGNGVPGSAIPMSQTLSRALHDAIQVDSDDEHLANHATPGITTAQAAQHDDDEQVEDALEVDYAEEDDEAMVSDNSLPPAAAPISVADEFGSGNNGNAVESTMTTGARSHAGATSHSTTAPVNIGSSRSESANRNSDADGVNGTTPSNNVVFAMTHSMLEGISHSPEPMRLNDTASAVPLSLVKDNADADYGVEADENQRLTRGVSSGSSGVPVDGEMMGTIVGSKRKR